NSSMDDKIRKINKELASKKPSRGGGNPHPWRRHKKQYDSAASSAINKHALFYGPPGTGKSHLARIFAENESCGFCFVSFETETYVGSGVTKGTDQGKIKPIAIIIDELDSVGVKDPSGSNTSANDEVNAILKMFDEINRENLNIVVVGITNYPSMLDGALTRPGRLGRQIKIPYPQGDEASQFAKEIAQEYKSHEVGFAFPDLEQALETSLAIKAKAGGEKIIPDKVLTQCSAGSLAYRGAKKATSYVAQKIATEIVRKTVEYGIFSIILQVKGIGKGRDAVIKEFLKKDSLKVEELIDKTPLPFNGTRVDNYFDKVFDLVVINASVITIGIFTISALAGLAPVPKNEEIIKPLIPINHLEGHIYARETLDDAIGECLDKAAILLGYNYPGGPLIEKLALSGKNTYQLPFPKNDKSCDFSFSGLKSKISRLVNKEEDVKIEVEENIVKVSGERKEEKKQDDAKQHYSEIFYGKFYREFVLPTLVKKKEVKARYENGVLTITAPKAPQSQDHQVNI
ncbi:3686_t:CDS:2, partial [Ambispora gerdemannii]